VCRRPDDLQRSLRRHPKRSDELRVLRARLRQRRALPRWPLRLWRRGQYLRRCVRRCAHRREQLRWLRQGLRKIRFLRQRELPLDRRRCVTADLRHAFLTTPPCGEGSTASTRDL
jgi:hypothetical protein